MKKKDTLTVYFDTNVFGGLAEDRSGDADQALRLLKESISQGGVVVVPSFEVFEELVSVLKLDPALSKKFCRLYDNLVDWEYCLKPMDQILADDIKTFVDTGKAGSPFNPIDESSPFIQPIRAGEYVLPEELLKDLIDKGTAQKKTFVENVLNVSGQFRAESDRKSSGEKDYDREFLGFWEPRGYAEKAAEMLVRNENDLSKVRVRGLAEFIKLPTIRLAVGYILHSKYKQVAHRAVCKDSDFYDFRHAVMAGAVANIVTQDRKLREAIHHVPSHSVRVWTLDQFITALS